MLSDMYVHNFEHAIDAYYKGAQVSDYTKRNHFLEVDLLIDDQGFLTSL